MDKDRFTAYRFAFLAGNGTAYEINAEFIPEFSIIGSRFVTILTFWCIAFMKI